jgi:hypothetical protein
MAEERMRANKTCFEQTLRNQISIAIVPISLPQQNAQKGDLPYTKKMAIWDFHILHQELREKTTRRRSLLQERLARYCTVRRRITQLGSDSWMKGSSSQGYFLMEAKARMVGLVGIDFISVGKLKRQLWMDGMDGVPVYN